MRGAFQAMWSGRVDRNWAREHHSLWYREIAEGVDTTGERDQPRAAHGAAAFASGAVGAVILALIMIGIYQATSITGTERTTASNTWVHVQAGERHARSK